MATKTKEPKREGRDATLDAAERTVPEKGFAGTAHRNDVLAWRKLFCGSLNKIAENIHHKRTSTWAPLPTWRRHWVLSKEIQDKDVFPAQIMLYRGFVRLVLLG